MIECSAIWGAGQFGRYICRQLKSRMHVTCFIDRNEEIQGTYIEGIEVLAPEKFFDKGNNRTEYVLIAFVNSLSLYDELRTYNGYKFGFIKDRLFWNQLSLQTDILKDENIFWVEDCSKPLLSDLETNIVDYCNLNCKGCSHFANLFKHGEMVSFEQYCKDLRQIASKVNVYNFDLLGGEPLLNPRLTEYIEFARVVMPGTRLRIITNGLLLQKQDDNFFQCCKENGVVIVITLYPPILSILDSVITLLQGKGIMYEIRRNKDEFGKNIDLSGGADKNTAMKQCRQHNCHFFRNGKLYKCPFSVMGNKLLEHYKCDIHFEGGIDIYDEDLNWKEVVYQLDYMPIEECRYCGEEVGYKWEVSPKPILEDWIIN